MALPTAGQIRKFLLALGGYALAGVCGYLASRLRVPLAWVLGPLLCAAAFSLAGVKLTSPQRVRQMGQVVIGATAGLNLTAAVAAGLVAWLPLMLGTAWISVVASGLASGFFAYFARLDGKTAFFALMPGGMAEMGNIGMTAGARMEPIALIHTFRVAIVVLVIPGLLVSHGNITPVVPLPDLPPATVALLLGACLGGAWLTGACRINNPWMIGALVTSAILSVSGLVTGHMPHLIFVSAQVLLGYAIGSRFKREVVRRLPRVAVVGVAMNLTLLALMGLYALGFSALTGLDLPTSVLVSSPGGTSEMTTTAQTLHLSVALVTAFHLVRTFLVNGFALYYWRLVEKLGYVEALTARLDRLFGRGAAGG